jgi:Ni,Fe-hydrogenase III component G
MSSEIIKEIEKKVLELGGLIESITKTSIFTEIPKKNIKDFAKRLYESGTFLKTCAGVDKRITNTKYY